MTATDMVVITSPNGLAREINEEHALCMDAAGDMLNHAIRAGELLALAKKQCRNGTWLKWVEDNCDFAAQTAQRYMRLYENRDKILNASQMTHLMLTDALKMISAPRENHQLINQSANNEWYTPPQYIAAVHEVMRGIDVDPASSVAANRTVKAKRFYTIKADGFKKRWAGRVFLNPPYGIEDGEGSNQARWSARLIDQYRSGITTEAILLVNAVPSNKWFASLWDFPICFTDHRIRFYNEDGEIGQPTHSNCFVYMGPKIDLFAKVFRKFGVIAVAYVLENER